MSSNTPSDITSADYYTLLKYAGEDFNKSSNKVKYKWFGIRYWHVSLLSFFMRELVHSGSLYLNTTKILVFSFGFNFFDKFSIDTE